MLKSNPVLECLLSPESAPLLSLTLFRIRLTPLNQSITLTLTTDESCLTVLKGAIRLVDAEGNLLCTTPPRAGVLEPPQMLCRLLSGAEPCAYTITLHAPSPSADVLLVSRTLEAPPLSAQVLCQAGSVLSHDVGTGTHRRTVHEWPTPQPFSINAGETVNVPGGWSSWPPHATLQQAEAQYADHEEVFFVITPGYGLMRMQGRYVTGEAAGGVRVIENGEALVTPLGSHPIVFSPGDFGWYGWWYYSTALVKTYNRWSTDLGTYVT